MYKLHTGQVPCYFYVLYTGPVLNYTYVCNFTKEVENTLVDSVDSAKNQSYLWTQICPFHIALIMDGNCFNTTEDNILGNFNTKASHARDEYIGGFHAPHRLMTKYIKLAGI